MRRTAAITLLASCTLAALVFVLPTDVEAGQRRRVIVGVGVGHGYYPYYYRPVFYDPFAWGYGGWYPNPWGPYRPYPGWGYDPAASVRIQTEPKEAQVYVDGYFVGIVDDFDGWSQRLRLPPGEREIQVYIDGERWERPAGEGRLTVDLAAGSHTVEVRSEGYSTYTAQVDVHSGRVTQVNVSLPEDQR